MFLFLYSQGCPIANIKISTNDLDIFLHCSLGELVKHGKNGYKFTSAQELSEQLQDWFENFPCNKQQQEKESQFKTELHTFQKFRWHENWISVAWPILK